MARYPIAHLRVGLKQQTLGIDGRQSSKEPLPLGRIFLHQGVETLAGHIGTVPAYSMGKCLEEERMPRIFSRADWKMRKAELEKHASPEMFNKLMSMVDDYVAISEKRFGLGIMALRLKGD